MVNRVLRIVLRRLLITLSMLSLILCLATIALWERSYSAKRTAFIDLWHVRTVNQLRRSIAFVVTSNNGSVNIARFDCMYPANSNLARISFGEALWNPFTPSGFRFSALSRNNDVVEFPHWSLAALFALLPAYSTIFVIRHRRRQHPGCCAACGYDLRASPGRCPECGEKYDRPTKADRAEEFSF